MSLKRKIYIFIIIFSGLSILLTVFLIYPIFLEIKKNSQDSLSQKQKLTALEKKVEDLERFRIVFSEISTNLKKIDNLFVNQKVPIDFISFLEKASQDSHLFLKISSGPFLKIEKDPWPSISFQLDLIGSFPNFLKFLTKLESSFYLIKIQNLAITRLSESELKSKEYQEFSFGDVKANLLIKVYVQ